MMKMEYLKSIVLGLLLLSVYGIARANCDKDKVDIIAANKIFMATFMKSDADALAKLYTKNSMLMPSNSDIVNGTEAIKLVWQSVFDAGIKEINLETLEVEGSANTLYEVGKYTLFVDEQKSVDSGKYIVIWKKEQGKWKLHRDIFNTSLPLENP